MEEMVIDTKGKVLVDQTLENLSSTKTVQTLHYDDGTSLRITSDNGDVHVECNKKVELSSDRKRVKILD